MVQYIDKSALVAEIERRIKGLEDCHADTVAGYNGEISGLKRLLSFLNTLKVKEVDLEPISEDLEEAAKKAGQKYFPDENNIWARPNYEAKAAEYAFKDGANWQKEQMMKDVVYGLVCGHDESSPAWIDLNLLNKPNVKVGTEVKLIIIEDDIL